VGDTEALTQALRSLMSNEPLMKQMSERNMTKAEMFKQEQIVDQWEVLINQVVSHYTARRK
jgi:glycosyltransferase involved in cell wall biosynthesis